MSSARDAITAKNKQRTLARRLRQFPEDAQARELFAKRYPQANATHKPTCKARKRAKRRAALTKAGALP